MIALESGSAVLALVFALTVALAGGWWLWWALILVYGVSSAATAWMHWRAGR